MIQAKREDLEKLDLRVGTIIDAKKLEGSEKLLLLKIDLGEKRERQLVGGLAKHYSPEELIGQQIVVIANFKPRLIFGQESQGMLLAAGDDQLVALLQPDKKVPPGTKIY